MYKYEQYLFPVRAISILISLVMINSNDTLNIIITGASAFRFKFCNFSSNFKPSAVLHSNLHGDVISWGVQQDSSTESVGPEELCSTLALEALSMETSVWERPRWSSVVFVPLRLRLRDELLTVRDRDRRVILAEGTVEKKMIKESETMIFLYIKCRIFLIIVQLLLLK